MNLISIYERLDRAALLYELMAERDETINISHRVMPPMDAHIEFIESRPYQAWYFIEDAGAIAGACYLSKQDEIGVFLFKEYQGRGHGPRAVESVMQKHGARRYLANINPRNARSAAIFAKLGFSLCQNTYERCLSSCP